jgi:hypothetical protein
MKNDVETYDHIRSVVLHKNDVYILAENDRVYGISNGIISTYSKIDHIISNNKSDLVYPLQILAEDDLFFIGYLRGVVCISKSGDSLWKITFNQNIQNISFYNNVLTVFNHDSIYCYSKTGKFIDKRQAHTMVGPFLQKDSLLYFGNLLADNTLSLTSYNLLSYNEEDYEAKSFNFFSEELFLADITLKHWVCFPFIKRNRILLVNRKEHRIDKIVHFANHTFAINENNLEQEQGAYPNFRVILKEEYNEGLVFYSKNDTIYTYSFKL